MTTYNKGDIVLVPFPFSDQTATKKRPAVIISSDRYNNTSLILLLWQLPAKLAKSYNRRVFNK